MHNGIPTPEYQKKFHRIYFRGLVAMEYAEDNPDSLRLSMEEYHLRDLATEAVASPGKDQIVYVTDRRRKVPTKSEWQGKCKVPVDRRVTAVSSRNHGASMPLDQPVINNYLDLRARYLEIIRPFLDHRLMELKQAHIDALFARYVYRSTYEEAAQYISEQTGLTVKGSKKRIDKAIKNILMVREKVA